jgi:formate hydrogenlyase transcriptional activator
VNSDNPVPGAAPQGEEQIARIVQNTISSLSGKQALNEHTKKQREKIIQALSDCKGRIGGPNGAAARMGLRRTTLVSRIRKLGINSHEYA